MTLGVRDVMLGHLGRAMDYNPASPMLVVGVVVAVVRGVIGRMSGGWLTFAYVLDDWPHWRWRARSPPCGSTSNSTQHCLWASPNRWAASRAPTGVQATGWQRRAVVERSGGRLRAPNLPAGVGAARRRRCCLFAWAGPAVAHASFVSARTRPGIGLADTVDLLVRSLPDITEEDLAFEAGALEPSEAGDFEPGPADSVHPSPERSH
jgi:hypothetical protein